MAREAPVLLDLFCGAGGAAMGYRRAGFRVVGVDLRPQPHYPFEFHQADALAFPLDGYDAIHASPPCQDMSVGNTWLSPNRARKQHPRLIQPMRDRLMRQNAPWVIENVVPSVSEMLHPIRICGTALGLRVQRHRMFDSSELLFAPGPCNHRPRDVSVRKHRADYLGAYIEVTTANGKAVRRCPGCTVLDARRAMGIEWMTLEELGESIPPAYTEWIGRQLLAALAAGQVA